MAEAKPKRRLGRVLRYGFGAVLFLLALQNALTGAPWYQCIIAFCVASIILVGGRRLIFRDGVRRSGGEIVCRYLPPYEGYTYAGAIWLPAFGIATLAAGLAGHNLAYLIGGIIILFVAALMMFFALLMWRRCILRITPSTLKVRAAVFGADARSLTEIRRDLVQAIEPRWVPRTFGFQVEIAYRGPGDTTKTVRLGPQAPQVSVQPTNLLNGLRAWKDGADVEPAELLDRVERILRGRATVGA